METTEKAKTIAIEIEDFAPTQLLSEDYIRMGLVDLMRAYGTSGEGSDSFIRAQKEKGKRGRFSFSYTIDKNLFSTFFLLMVEFIS